MYSPEKILNLYLMELKSTGEKILADLLFLSKHFLANMFHDIYGAKLLAGLGLCRQQRFRRQNAA
jgi:hypothetical protein